MKTSKHKLKRIWILLKYRITKARFNLAWKTSTRIALDIKLDKMEDQLFNQDMDNETLMDIDEKDYNDKLEMKIGDL
jgi:hypothetical protein